MPRYYQVYSVLRQRIEDGAYRDGDRLPPEDALATEWNVSRATLRQAMAELDASGLVDRQQGRGTFVVRAGGRAQGPTLRGSLDDLITATRPAGTVDVTVRRGVALPPHVAARLQLSEPTGTVIARRRLDESGSPYGWLVNYLADSFTDGLAEAELYRSTLLEVLESRGVRLGGAEQRIRARVADVDVAEALGVPVGEPVLAVERLVLDRDRTPVELLHSSYRSDAYDYRVVFTR
jgi:GntR family transcriptional regulator